MGGSPLLLIGRIGVIFRVFIEHIILFNFIIRRFAFYQIRSEVALGFACSLPIVVALFVQLIRECLTQTWYRSLWDLRIRAISAASLLVLGGGLWDTVLQASSYAVAGRGTVASLMALALSLVAHHLVAEDRLTAAAGCRFTIASPASFIWGSLDTRNRVASSGNGATHAADFLDKWS